MTKYLTNLYIYSVTRQGIYDENSAVKKVFCIDKTLHASLI